MNPHQNFKGGEGGGGSNAGWSPYSVVLFCRCLPGALLAILAVVGIIFLLGIRWCVQSSIVAPSRKLGSLLLERLGLKGFSPGSIISKGQGIYDLVRLEIVKVLEALKTPEDKDDIDELNHINISDTVIHPDEPAPGTASTNSENDAVNPVAPQDLDENVHDEDDDTPQAKLP